MSIDETKKLIQWLIDEKLVITYFNKKYQEQIIEITDFGITVNEILNKLKIDSEAAKKTNEFMKKIDEKS